MIGRRAGNLIRRVKSGRSGRGATDCDLGDLARDQRNWLQAETFYTRHLLAVPDDTPIWVQLGHALKEQGKLSEALQAYRHADSRNPDDHDLCNHLAHLLKRLGYEDEAVILFTKVFRIAGTREAYHEVSQLGSRDACDEGDVRAARTMSTDCVFIELDDLFGFLEAHKTVTGIQRVQLGVIEYALADSSRMKNYAFVLNEVGIPYLWRLETSDIVAVTSYLKEDFVDHERLRLLVRLARRGAEAVLARPGQGYLILGAFWGYGAVSTRYAKLKHAGVALGALIYDLIPITHTEYCDEGLPHEFKLSFGDGFAVFDFVLAISEYSAEEIRHYITRFKLPTIPVIAVPLAHTNDISARASPSLLTDASTKTKLQRPKSCGEGAISSTQGQATEGALAKLRGREFAMMVSTIEARKNHNYLVSAWKHFVNEGLDPPDLVFVGRPGWRVTSLMEMLTTTRYLDGRVHILHDLSDHQLTTLYDECLFTLFPSFIEGWGLPVGESLSRGKPCIASSTSSIPEVGGDLVDYVDPLNLRDGIEVIRRMTFDTGYRNRRTDEIRKAFKARTWSEVGADLLEDVDKLRKTLTVNTEPEVLFPTDSIFRPGDLALGNRLPENYAARPLRSMLVDGWYGVEAFGCWMAGRQGDLLFRSDLAPGTPIVIYLSLCTPGHLTDLRLDVAVGIGEYDIKPIIDADAEIILKQSMPVPFEGNFNAVIRGLVGPRSLVRVRLTLSAGPKPVGDDSRPFGVGIRSVCYTVSSDLDRRVQLVENLLLNRPSIEVN